VDEIIIIEDLADLDGTCYIELMFGHYQNKCWNNGSLFLSEEVFGYIEPLFERYIDGYDHYAFTYLDIVHCRLILKHLNTLCSELQQIKSVAELPKAIGFFFKDTESQFKENFLDNICSLVIVLQNLIGWFNKYPDNQEGVTILGI
jgi:hypothetical protein